MRSSRKDSPLWLSPLLLWKWAMVSCWVARRKGRFQRLLGQNPSCRGIAKSLKKSTVFVLDLLTFSKQNSTFRGSPLDAVMMMMMVVMVMVMPLPYLPLFVSTSLSAAEVEYIWFWSCHALRFPAAHELPMKTSKIEKDGLGQNSRLRLPNWFSSFLSTHLICDIAFTKRVCWRDIPAINSVSNFQLQD